MITTRGYILVNENEALIRQIEKKAILKLRRYCKNNEKLIPYLTYFDNVKVEDYYGKNN